jgi:hypothetical protein
MKRKRLAAGVATDLTDRYVVFFQEQRTGCCMIKSVATPAARRFLFIGFETISLEIHSRIFK